MSLEREDQWRFDLPAANAQQLAAEGVRQIEQAHLCTACHQDEFYSHRGDNGQTGRFAVVTYLEHKSRSEEMVEPAAGQAIPPQGEAERVGLTEPNSLHPPGFPAFGEILE
jgi:cytochrome c553